MSSVAQPLDEHTLTRTSTSPTAIANTPTRSNELQRQTSANSTGTTPVQTVTNYLKHLFGLNAKPTKRSLSEEAECGSPESIGEWLRQGSNPNELDAYGYTPLVNACLRGCIRSAKILVNNGADVNMKAMHGYAPLHAASQNGFAELVELLVEYGADLEIKNDDGDTPLMLAVRSDHPAVVDVLCKHGCDMHTHGFDNIEPIDYAMNKRNLYLSDVLMKHERQHIGNDHNHTHHHDSHSNSIHAHDTNNNNLETIKECPSLSTLVYQQQEIHQQQEQEKEQEKKQDETVFQSD